MASAKRQRHRERRLIQESASAVLEQVRSDLVAVDEASLRRDGTAALRLISPGWGSSGFYSGEVLEAAADAGIWPAGTQMYWDHPTASDNMDRPERSLRDLAAVLETEGRWDANHPDGPGVYAQAKVFEGYKVALAEMAPYIGVSIRAAAEVSTGEAQGRRGRIVERIVEAKSVDFVTKPGRGGQVLAILESHRLTEAGMWEDDVRQALRDALADRFTADDADSYLWVRDHTDSLVVYELSGAGDNNGTWQVGYTLGDDGTVTIADGDPAEVKVTTTYTPIGEARNVGQWIESQLHRSFTCMADDMAAEGRLTREERISLSSAIGDALGVFVQTVEQAQPQLYRRDLYEDPGATVTESLEDTMTPEEIKEAMTEAAQAAVAPIQEALAKVTNDLGEAKGENDKLRTALLVRDARTHVSEALAKVEGLPAVAKTKIVEAVAGDPPVTDAGALDVAKLDEAVKAEVKGWADILSEAGGSPIRGVGESDDTPVEEAAEKVDEALEAAFGRIGLTESAAKTAAAGRGR